MQLLMQAKKRFLPCNPAFIEKKTPVIIGPYVTCPRTIFLKVVKTSRFGRILETKLNQKCKEGPETSNP